MHKAAAAAFIGLSSLAASAATVTYDFSWAGINGYTMTGNFSFDSASAADGAIRDQEVTSLFFQDFKDGVLLGSSSNARSVAHFNFNFNSLTGQFFTAGSAASDSGQRWNEQPDSIGGGFQSGSGGSAVFLDGEFIASSFAMGSWPLTATLRSNDVPEPGSLALIGLGLVGLVVARKRKPA